MAVSNKKGECVVIRDKDGKATESQMPRVGQRGKLRRFGRLYTAEVTEVFHSRVRVKFVTYSGKPRFTATPIRVALSRDDFINGLGAFYPTVFG